MSKHLPIVGAPTAPSPSATQTTTPAPTSTPRSYEAETQAYSTWGGKLLQHTDVLHTIQSERVFRPITIQLAPTEICTSHCPFCSVDNRPKGKIPWDVATKLLRDFRALGAKSVENTGGGDPLMYRDGDKNINDLLRLQLDLGYAVGIITDTAQVRRFLAPDVARRIAWLRVSLIKLDEGTTPEEYDFGEVPPERVAASYIVYDGTTVESIERIARLVELHPALKFVRIAPNCLNDDALTIKGKWGPIVEALDRHGKFFIKEINDDYRAFPGGCWVGMLRPYVVSTGVFICTSHVLINRTYHPTWKLCDHGEVLAAWERMNVRFAQGLSPYEIDIAGECKHCYYQQSNRILHYVTTELPDKAFA